MGHRTARRVTSVHELHIRVGHLEKALEVAAADGWTVVDMKREWKTIFPVEP
jgi:hypothetical protein